MPSSFTLLPEESTAEKVHSSADPVQHQAAGSLDRDVENASAAGRHGPEGPVGPPAV
jgi:hypothetical protein